VRNLIGFYEAREIVGFDRFLQAQAWLDRGLAWLAMRRGLQVAAALLEVDLMLKGVILERTGGLGFRLLANKLARRESQPNPGD
jgi:hypothetical protein